MTEYFGFPSNTGFPRYKHPASRPTKEEEAPMIVRARWKVGGGYTHVRVFVGEAEGFTFAKAGDLCFRNEEWEGIWPGLKRLGWQVLPEDEPAERGILFVSEGPLNTGKCPETTLDIVSDEIERLAKGE